MTQGRYDFLLTWDVDRRKEGGPCIPLYMEKTPRLRKKLHDFALPCRSFALCSEGSATLFVVSEGEKDGSEQVPAGGVAKQAIRLVSQTAVQSQGAEKQPTTRRKGCLCQVGGHGAGAGVYAA